MRCAILAFVCGVALLQSSASLPGRDAALVGLAGLLLWALVTRGLLRALGCGLLCGYGWAALLAHLALAPTLAASKASEINVFLSFTGSFKVTKS